MLDFAEVLRSESEQRSSVELCVPADVIVDLGRELVAMLIEPELRCAVFAFDENLGRVPVRPLAGEIVTTLEEQDPLSRRGESMGECAPACAGTNDDDVVMLIVGHERPPGIWCCLRTPRQTSRSGIC